MASDRSGPADPVQRAMLGVLPSVGARPNHEVYFSTPITTGEQFVQWRRHGNWLSDIELEEEHAVEVVGLLIPILYFLVIWWKASLSVWDGLLLTAICFASAQTATPGSQARSRIRAARLVTSAPRT